MLVSPLRSVGVTRFEVGAVRSEEDYRYLYVQPDKEPDRLYPYYEMLANVEAELEKKHNLRVLFIPTEPIPSREVG